VTDHDCVAKTVDIGNVTDDPWDLSFGESHEKNTSAQPPKRAFPNSAAAISSPVKGLLKASYGSPGEFIPLHFISSCTVYLYGSRWDQSWYNIVICSKHSCIHKNYEVHVVLLTVHTTLNIVCSTSVLSYRALILLLFSLCLLILITTISIVT
jgi:hypothetical protein